MLDIRTIREHPESVLDSLKKRNQEEKAPLVKEAQEKDKEWRKTKGELDELRHKRNRVSEDINKAKKEGKDASKLMAEAKSIPGKLKELEDREEQLRTRIIEILRTLPNLLDPEVPEGKDASQNVAREELGKKTELGFPARSHVELCEQLGIADFEASRRTSGHGFFFLKGDLALLDQALQRYALDMMLQEGFTPIVPPYMIRKEIVDGVVDLHFFEEIIYKLEGEDLYPISTSEHPLIGMMEGQDIPVNELPVKLCGISPCFRKELGAHGIDEKGLFRTHQFNKIEQVVICKPEESREWYEKLLGITKKIFTGLGIPTRVWESCAGDLGDLKARGADLEAWSPRRKEYFEVASVSNLTDAQARRLRIKMLYPDGTREYAHTLNNTALATSRAMVAIIENYQQKDGTVKVPFVLVPYMGGKKVIKSVS